MKTVIKHISIGLLIVFVLVSCDRDISDGATFTTFPTTAEIFTDNFIGLGADFYFPFVGDGARPDVFEVDNTISFLGDTSWRFDVPNADDPLGNFVGANITVADGPRNLTGFTALTFYARASRGAPVDLGFGLGQTRVATTHSVGTGWNRYVVPIPDPSILFEETTFMNVVAGTLDTEGFGYSFWLDEIRFEDLSSETVAQIPRMFNGENVQMQVVGNSVVNITGLNSTFNFIDGTNQTVDTSPGYFEFRSSDPRVASVDQFGVVTAREEGTAVITASVDGISAQGSLTVNTIGAFISAPDPTRPAVNVISLFSDSYNDVPIDFVNGFFQFSTTQGGAVNIAGDNIISYTDLNFVGIGTFLNVEPIDATNMDGLHVDINVQEELDPGDFIIIRVLNDIGGNEIQGDFVINANQLANNSWRSFDISLDGLNLADRSRLGLVFFVSDGTISNIFADNVYYFRE